MFLFLLWLLKSKGYYYYESNKKVWDLLIEMLKKIFKGFEIFIVDILYIW